MLIMEQELTEAEATLLFLQEAVHDPKNQKLREELIDPVISVLETQEFTVVEVATPASTTNRLPNSFTVVETAEPPE